jgi:hypothetical protein
MGITPDELARAHASGTLSKREMHELAVRRPPLPPNPPPPPANPDDD